MWTSRVLLFDLSSAIALSLSHGRGSLPVGLGDQSRSKYEFLRDRRPPCLQCPLLVLRIFPCHATQVVQRGWRGQR